MSTDVRERESESAGHPAPLTGKSYLRDRVLLPLGIIAIGGLVIVVLILNISRIFLSGPGNQAIALCGIVAAVGFFAATWASYQSRLPTSQSLALVAAAAVLIITSGWALIDKAEEHGEEEVVAATFVHFDSFNFAFDPSRAEAATNAEAPAVEIELTSRQASHTFVIEGMEAEFKLAADTGSGETGRVVLEPGDYVFYCDIPGHRQNGMEGVLTVAEAPPGTVLGGAEGGEAPAEET